MKGSWTWGALALGLAGCLPSGGGGGACSAGQVSACVCLDGRAGTRTCGDDGVQGACVCAGDAGVGRADGGVGGTDAGCTPDCVGRDCGDDGCGGSCGPCGGPGMCSEMGQCVAAPPGCGDAFCDAGEDCSTCPQDCADCCGDGVCARSEDCATCAADCACAVGRSCTAAGVCEADTCEGEGCGAPPRILTFNANVRRLTEGAAVTFSAVVTDPDGIADLIGGVLEDPGGASFGAFATAGEEGAYQLVLSWDAMHAVAPIEFDGQANRDVIAVFFDQAGNRVTEALTLTLHCDEAGGAACAGRCTDLSNPTHCGACRAACADECRDRQCRCPGGLTRCDGACVDTRISVEHCGRCENACAQAQGGEARCVAGACADPCAAQGETNCGGQCVNLSTRTSDCGRCGNVCEAPAGGRATCQRGACGVTCDAGRRLCGERCVECPAEGVAETACEGNACVAVECAAQHRLCERVCARCPGGGAETACAGRACVAVVCPAGQHPCAEGCCDWRFEDLAPGAGNIDLAVDANGVPHVVVSRDETVRFGGRVAGRWALEEVLTVARDIQNSVDVALAFHGLDAYLAYAWLAPPPPGGSAPGEAHVALLAEGEPSDLAVRRGSGSAAPRDPTLAITAAGAVHFCYDGGGAHCGVVGQNGDRMVSEGAGWGPHLVLHQGDPHVAWWNLGPRTLGYTSAEDGWRALAPDAPPDSGFAPRVAVDSTGAPLIAHRGDDGPLYLTERTADGWRTIEPLPGIAVDIGHDLVIDARDQPVLCFGALDGLRIARRDGDRWLVDHVTRSPARACRLAIGPDGALHVVFRDESNSMFRYAY